MRFYEIKEVTTEGDPQPLSYARMMEAVLTVDMKLATDQFLRLSALFQRVKAASAGDVLPVDDEDYKLVQQKLEAYMGNVRGAALTVPAFADFIKSVKDMPTKDPKSPVKLVEPKKED